MPPRISPTSSQGRNTGRGRGIPLSPSSADSEVPSHITTIGTRRPGFGQAGVRKILVTNAFEVKIPQSVITHYDVGTCPSSSSPTTRADQLYQVIIPSERTLPVRVNMKIISALQNQNSAIFNPRAVYDGRKNLFSSKPLKLANGDTQTFDVLVGPGDGDPSSTAVQRTPGDASVKGDKIFKVKLTKVAEINPTVLERFLQGKQSYDNSVLTAITALNVVIRMEPTMRYPFNIRSFFTDSEQKDIGNGLILWRGYFQSARPASGKMLINVDISTGTMYKKGPLIGLCLDFLGAQDPHSLSQHRGFNDRDRIRLQRFLSGVRVITTHTGPPSSDSPQRVIKKFTANGATELRFPLREGGEMTVAEYFNRFHNKPLQFPNLPCVEVGSGALLPLEFCYVPSGQIMRKQVPSTKTKDILSFATKRPQERLASIKRGLSVLSFGTSSYVRAFGLQLDPSLSPLKVNARVLPAPTLRYGPGSKPVNVVPKDGAWNMVDKKFYKPATLKLWMIAIYEPENRWGRGYVESLIKGLLLGFANVGMQCMNKQPFVVYPLGQGSIAAGLREAGSKMREQKGDFPGLIVAVIPDSGMDIYTAVKHFGDCTTGVATQCLKSHRCHDAAPQYYANVCLKINVKLGGINMIPDPSSIRYLVDPANPTIVMGADVIHPAPGSDGRPSFTALVANVDSESAKYIAETRVQTSRQEMIEDIRDMAKTILVKYMGYREQVEKRPNKLPKRIIFYRDGVSEGQFRQVLEQEIPELRAACQDLKIEPMPKLTVVIVGKRHHVRFFPTSVQDSDKSGNCPAGTVVDRDVTHPTEFDFYLQSHGGILGTSRPAHYNVLLDENGFSPDGIQQLSFALCHVYARSTRSVSIPAPVYYADIVCSRAKNHYDPEQNVDLSDSASQLDNPVTTLENFRNLFKRTHEKMARTMYFS